MWKFVKERHVMRDRSQIRSDIAANKHIKQKRLKNHSQLKFTPSLLQRDSALSLHERPYASLRLYSCAPSQAKQLLLKYLLVICPSLCASASFMIISPAASEEETQRKRKRRKELQEEEEKEDITEIKLEQPWPHKAFDNWSRQFVRRGADLIGLAGMLLYHAVAF